MDKGRFPVMAADHITVNNRMTGAPGDNGFLHAVASSALVAGLVGVALRLMFP